MLLLMLLLLMLLLLLLRLMRLLLWLLQLLRLLRLLRLRLCLGCCLGLCAWVVVECFGEKIVEGHRVGLDRLTQMRVQVMRVQVINR